MEYEVTFLLKKKRNQKKTAQKNLVMSPFSLCSFGFLRNKLVGPYVLDKFGRRYFLCESF